MPQKKPITKQKQKTKVTKTKDGRLKKLLVAIVVILIAGIGTYLLKVSNAATGCVADNVCDVRMLYSSSANDGVLTHDNRETLGLLGGGWNNNEVQFKAYLSEYPGTVGVTRLMNPINNRHFFTINQQEVTNHQAFGAKIEAVPFYVFNHQASNTVPIYRLNHPALSNYFYVSDIGMRDALINQYGWVNQGVAFYAYPPSYKPNPLPEQPAPKPQPPKPVECRLQNLTPYSKGDCVKVLKAMVNKINPNAKLDSNNNGFDGALHNQLLNFTKLKMFDGTDPYVNIVTPNIWDRLIHWVNTKNTPPPAQQPATPVTPTTDQNKPSSNPAVNCPTTLAQYLSKYRGTTTKNEDPCIRYIQLAINTIRKRSGRVDQQQISVTGYWNSETENEITQLINVAKWSEGEDKECKVAKSQYEALAKSVKDIESTIDTLENLVEKYRLTTPQIKKDKEFFSRWVAIKGSMATIEQEIYMKRCIGTRTLRFGVFTKIQQFMPELMRKKNSINYRSIIFRRTKLF